ncbi:MAG: methylcobamide--CoM methyltransferase [Lachnospiraceae bacterium]|nr:methylcobamide--CoM methyltransferase [Lachnospiraceae bacterium]
MDRKAKVSEILNKKHAVHPPCICPGGMMNMITTELLNEGGYSFREAHTNGVLMASLAEYAYQQGCFENVGVPFCMTVEAEQFGAEVELGDNTKEPRVVKYCLESFNDVEKLEGFRLEEGRMKATLDAIKRLREEDLDAPVIGNLTGPISVASSIMDPNLFYVGLNKKSEEAHRLMEIVTRELIRFGQAMIDAGADVIMIADPSGTGEIMGPKYFEEYTVKYLNDLIDGMNTENVVTIVHICGKMTPVLKETNHIKSDVLSFDAIVSLKKIREFMGDRLIMGNVSTYAIEGNTSDNVKRLAQNCIKQGMDIVSPACGLGMGSPLKNVRAVLEGVEQCQV